MGNVFKRMRLLQGAVGISGNITLVTRMEKRTEKLIHSALLLRITVHWQTVFALFSPILNPVCKKVFYLKQGCELEAFLIEFKFEFEFTKKLQVRVRVRAL